MQIGLMETGAAAKEAVSGTKCPGCGSSEVRRGFYDLAMVPVHSVKQIPSREKAVNFKTGDISLGACSACGLVYNISFNHALIEYAADCEESQSHSRHHCGFSRALAGRLIEKYSVRGKNILEIGCGKGDFLRTLCELGGNTGTGIDPAYVRSEKDDAISVSFYADYYSEKYAFLQKPDLLVCQMTLEHVWNPGKILRLMRAASKDDTVLFIQVPDAERIFREYAFWDIYYEHCNYFTFASLKKLLEFSGFRILERLSAYEGQYMIVEAVPAKENTGQDVTSFSAQDVMLDDFASGVLQKRFLWGQRLREMAETTYRSVLWGGGSKAVAFLTTLGIGPEVKYAVDINPARRNMYIAGTGQEIVQPSFLKVYRPDAVILMNPVYAAEVKDELARLGLSARVFTP